MELPLKLTPVYKDYLWGGTRLQEVYAKGEGMDKVAESWELSCHENGLSRIANGPHQGKTLREAAGELPLLFKLIDAREPLSIQVHPAGDGGKTEMWYVLEAEEGATIGYGFKVPTTADAVRQGAAQGTLEELISYVPARRGDVFFIPGGRVHAIGKGLLIAELQQSSDTTYRLYDYNRRVDGKLRPLHIDEALAVADLTPAVREEHREILTHGDAVYERLAGCEYFHACRLTVKGRESLNPNGWKGIFIISGEARLTGADGAVELVKGETAYLPCPVEAAGEFEAFYFGKENFLTEF